MKTHPKKNPGRHQAQRGFFCKINPMQDQNGISSSAKSSIGGADCCCAGA